MKEDIETFVDISLKSSLESISEETIRACVTRSNKITDCAKNLRGIYKKFGVEIAVCALTKMHDEKLEQYCSGAKSLPIKRVK